MFAEENILSPSDAPEMSISKGRTINCIIKAQKQSVAPFRNALNSESLKNPLNENKLTQIFVEQTDIQLRKLNYAIGVKNQYSDLFWGTRGIPDYYFHRLEEGLVSEPLFIVEAKRLPAPTPPKTREKEYVISDKQGGGIQRYKFGKHGKGFDECGMLGFLENEDFPHWINTINSWIDELVKSDGVNWHSGEIIKHGYSNEIYSYSKSIVDKISGTKCDLHHLWIALK